MRLRHRFLLPPLLALSFLFGCAAAPVAKPTMPAPPAALTQPAPASPIAERSPLPAAIPSASPSVAAQVPIAPPRLDLRVTASGFNQPVQVTHAGDSSGRQFVVEKKGRIIALRGGVPHGTPFLDIQPLVGSAGNEQGLLSVAFHPRFSQNRQLYVNYTDLNGHTVVARYTASESNPDFVDPGSALTIITIEQPAANHNGGLVLFGPDGYLYIGMGDGGRAGDPWGNAQNRGVLLGKMLRIDVDRAEPYAIPPSNPFVGDPAARPEVWAYGLRNPWRFAFDRANGDLYIGDVGQNIWEWVHLQRAGSPGGENYGWNAIEGSHCYPQGRACDPSRYVLPIAEYDHSLGCSVTGGHVYRGRAFPRLSGTYVFGDYCSGRVWTLRPSSAGAWEMAEAFKVNLRISSFGEDEAGEVYLTGYSDGVVYQLVER